MRFDKTAALALVAAAALMPLAASAADLSAPRAAPILAPSFTPAYNWTGGYIGGQLGYGWSNTRVGEVSFFDDVDGTLPSGGLPGFAFNGSGLIGGAELGYNWQANGLVVGVEGDISATGITANFADAGPDFTLDTKLNWLSTARLKLGLPVQNFLFYGTAGLAVGGIQANLHDNYPSDTTVYNLSDSNTAVGWTVGGGVAAAINSHWVVKAEYLYTDLGTHTYSYSEDPTGAIGWPLLTASAKTTASVVRVGIDYKF